MAMVSAAGLTAEAGAAQHARDLGDAVAADRALGRAELLVARVRACAEDGGCLERGFLAVAEADYARAIGQDDPALWHAAAAEWDHLSRPYAAAIARWRQGEALVAAGERDAAAAGGRHRARRRPSGSARRGWPGSSSRSAPARACGCAATCEPEDGADGGEPEDEDPFGLTPRERQVLALVAAGATNREIGRQLYMAEKTASVHVSRILAKLDVRSRTEAAGVAHRLGLDAVV